MPKRIGFLYEKFCSLENCIAAERLMSKNKPDNAMARHIGENAETFGAALSDMLARNAWTPHPNREFTIQDSYKGKTRNLKVPCLQDQAVQYAWLNIATPFIEKKNYFYNCGSIPGAGQFQFSPLREGRRSCGGRVRRTGRFQFSPLREGRHGVL